MIRKRAQTFNKRLSFLKDLQKIDESVEDTERSRQRGSVVSPFTKILRAKIRGSFDLQDQKRKRHMTNMRARANSNFNNQNPDSATLKKKRNLIRPRLISEFNEKSIISPIPFKYVGDQSKSKDVSMTLTNKGGSVEFTSKGNKTTTKTSKSSNFIKKSDKSEITLFLKMTRDSVRKTMSYFEKNSGSVKYDKYEQFNKLRCINGSSFNRIYFLRDFISSLEGILADIQAYHKKGSTHVSRSKIRSANSRFNSRISALLGSTSISILIYYQCKILMVHNCYEEALKSCELGLTVAYIDKSSELILRFYTLKGHLNEKIRNFDLSLKFYTKALRYSWLIQDMYHEVFLYDRIGMQYYHLEDMKRAIGIHKRMTMGYIEPSFSENVIQSREGLLKDHKLILSNMAINPNNFTHKFTSILQVINGKVRVYREPLVEDENEVINLFHDTLINNRKKYDEFCIDVMELKHKRIKSMRARRPKPINLENQSLEENLKERQQSKQIELSLRQRNIKSSYDAKRPRQNYYEKRRKYLTSTMQKKFVKVQFTKNGMKHLLKNNGFPSSFEQYNMPIDNFDSRSAFLSNLVINSKVVRSHERDFSTIQAFLKSSFKKRSKSAVRGANTTSFNLNRSRTNKSMGRSKSQTSRNSTSGHSIYNFKPYGEYKNSVEDTETYIKAIIRILRSYMKKAIHGNNGNNVGFTRDNFKLERQKTVDRSGISWNDSFML